MEQFFTSTRPLRYDLLEEYPHGEAPFECNEIELTVSIENFLVCNWDWTDLQAVLTDGVTPKVLWITENKFVFVKENGNDSHFDLNRFNGYVDAIFQETSGQEQTLTLVRLDHDRDIRISNGEDGVFWRAITTSNCVKLMIYNNDNRLELPSGPLLSKFLRKNLSLQRLDFQMFDFNEEHCHALATLERTDLVVTLSYCTLIPEDAEDVFIEWLRNNQVVTELDRCDMDSNIVCALSGNNSVKKITIGGSDYNEEVIRSLAQALPGNTGIEYLDISDFEYSDETWIRLIRSLSTHSRIKLLSLTLSWMPDRLSAESKSTRMNAILHMLHLNTVVHTINLRDVLDDEEVYQNAILPRLEMNRTCFEVQRQAVKRADPSIRPQLLGRALHAVRYNPNLVFHFLSDNVPAFVRTEEEEVVGDSTIPLQNDPAVVSGKKRKAP
jgi:hypothetical protein